MASKSTAGSQRDDDVDPSMPIFFYMPNEHPYGIFCQWHKSYFTVAKSSFAYLDRNTLPDKTPQAGVENVSQKLGSTTLSRSSTSSVGNNARKREEGTVTFGCCEQYMKYCKAVFFHDTASAKRIMSSSNPKEQKAIGRKVNAVWGIGLNEAMAIAMWNALGAEAEESWGLNLLGKAIMAVRERMVREMVGEDGKTEGEMGEEEVKREREKKVRSLNKRLRDIKGLKEKRDTGEKLQPNQIEKIEREGELKRELDEFGGEEVVVA
ncbi:DUF1768-domain-containing protein [Venturia nashicola]|nr:DUF1768-domain-containing protein [Venturia nashicola]